MSSCTAVSCDWRGSDILDYLKTPRFLNVDCFKFDVQEFYPCCKAGLEDVKLKEKEKCVLKYYIMPNSITDQHSFYLSLIKIVVWEKSKSWQVTADTIIVHWHFYTEYVIVPFRFQNSWQSPHNSIKRCTLKAIKEWITQ